MDREEGRRAPLRKVLWSGLNGHGAEIEELACGHIVSRKQDAFGPTNAYRRRCRRCQLGRPQDFDPEQRESDD